MLRRANIRRPIHASHPCHIPGTQRTLPIELFHEIFQFLAHDELDTWVVIESRYDYAKIALACRFFYVIMQPYLFQDLFTINHGENPSTTRLELSDEELDNSAQLCDSIVAGTEKALSLAKYVKRWIISVRRDSLHEDFLRTPYLEAAPKLINLSKLTLCGVTLTSGVFDHLLLCKSLEELRLVACFLTRDRAQAEKKFGLLRMKRLHLVLGYSVYKHLRQHINFARLERLYLPECEPPSRLCRGSKPLLKHMEFLKFYSPEDVDDMLEMTPNAESLRVEEVSLRCDDRYELMGLQPNHLPHLRHLVFPICSTLRVFLGGQRPISSIEILDSNDEEPDPWPESCTALDIEPTITVGLEVVKEKLEHLNVNLETYSMSCDDWSVFSELRRLELRANTMRDVGSIDKALERIAAWDELHNAYVSKLTIRLPKDDWVDDMKCDSGSYFDGWLKRLGLAFPNARAAYIAGGLSLRSFRLGSRQDWEMPVV